MEPTLMAGQIVIAWRQTPKVGDLVIAKIHGKEVLKRVTKSDTKRVYLLGDNSANSTDSRDYGWIPMSSVRGVVVKIF
jgi:type IV secretory pathway protease TraF